MGVDGVPREMEVPRDLGGVDEPGPSGDQPFLMEQLNDAARDRLDEIVRGMGAHEGASPRRSAVRQA